MAELGVTSGQVNESEVWVVPSMSDPTTLSTCMASLEPVMTADGKSNGDESVMLLCESPSLQLTRNCHALPCAP